MSRTTRAALSQITQGADRSIEAQSSPAAHQGARVIGADELRIVLISPDPSDGQECNQDNEGNPNINAHQSSPATGSVPRAIGAGQYCRLSKQVWPAPIARGTEPVAGL